MRTWTRNLLVIVATLMLTTPLALADEDLTVEIADWVDPALVGEVVTYTVTVANIGNQDPRPTLVDIYLPLGVPTTIDAYMADDAEALAAMDTFFESILVSEEFANDENFGIYMGLDTLYCEGLKIQPQDFPLPPGASGEIVYQLTMPQVPVTETFVHASGTDFDLDVTHFGKGICDQNANCINEPCLGPRLTTIGQITGPLQLIDDQYVDPSDECLGNDPETGTLHDGCTPFTMPGPGQIALIERGCCGMEAKALNASQSGAIAAVVTDYDDFTDSTTEPHHIWYMGCFDFCSSGIITTPNVFLSLADSEQIYAALDGGEVTVTMGARDVEAITTRANIWQSGDYLSNQFSNDNDNWVETTTIYEEVTIEPPVASFTFSPDEPMIGGTVDFTDSSSNSPTTWAWNFGDDQGTSSEQNPSYTFSAAGTYPVSLIASNDGGSDTATADVTVTDIPIPTLDFYYFVPAAAKAEGAENSFFLTELAVNNPGPNPATFKFLWLPRGVDNTEPTASEIFTLGPGLNVLYSDVLGEVFGVEDGAVGAFAILSDSNALLLMSRTCNDSGDGTFGQSIPGFTAGELISPNVRKRILFFVENDDFRSNLGLMNGTERALRISWERFGPDGVSYQVGFTDLPAFGNTQINQIFRDEAPVRGGFIDVWTTTDEGAFAAYGSLLDNRTSDPTTILPR